MFGNLNCEFSLGGHKFVGGSVAGIATSIAMPEMGLCLDVAQGFDFAVSSSQFFITHGHLDHAAGIPYIISQKAMLHQNPPIFHMPPSMISPLEEIMKTWMKIEGHQYQFEFKTLLGPESAPIKNGFFMRAFPTVHRIPSQGYTLFQKRKHLKSEYVGLASQELGRLRRQGTQLEEQSEVPVVSFTGDTQIEFLDRSPEVKKSQILFLEVTYLDDKKSVEHARKWGHLHLDELVLRAEELQNEVICVMHVSRRYSSGDIERILKYKLPKQVWDRVFVVPSFDTTKIILSKDSEGL